MFDRRSVLIGRPGLLVACSKHGNVDLESAVEGALASPLGDTLGASSLIAGDSGPVETPGYPYHHDCTLLPLRSPASYALPLFN